MANLLKNPGFEGDWWRRTFTGQEFGEIFVPERWVAYWKEGRPVLHDPTNPNGYGRPEMHVINREPPFLDPLRVRTGNRALKFFTFYRIHDAGVYQQIADVAPGTRLQATGWAHAWSSTDDDPSSSDGAGARAYFARASEVQRTDAPLENGIQNVTFTVGIDPAGGIDPWSDAVVWGEGAHIYNAFAQIPPVEVAAQAQTITFFVRSQVLWPFKHCDAYIDDMRLTVLEGPSEPLEVRLSPEAVRAGRPFEVHISGGAEPERIAVDFSSESIFRKELRADGCRIVCRCVAVEPGRYQVRVSAGMEQMVALSFDVASATGEVSSGFVPPRAPYARTYLLLPPGAGDEWLEAVRASGVWARHHWTIGGNPDDAGIGPLQRRVVAINPQMWSGDLERFFSVHYPGLEYVTLTVATPSDLEEALRGM